MVGCRTCIDRGRCNEFDRERGIACVDYAPEKKEVHTIMGNTRYMVKKWIARQRGADLMCGSVTVCTDTAAQAVVEEWERTNDDGYCEVIEV